MNFKRKNIIEICRHVQYSFSYSRFAQSYFDISQNKAENEYSPHRYKGFNNTADYIISRGILR